MDKISGHYLGTEVDEKWWKRLTEYKFFIRGNGKYWFDDDGLYFLRYLIKEPIFIHYNSMFDIKTGKWHSGKWGGGNIVIKIIWNKKGKRLSSGFIFSKNKDEIENIKKFLEEKIV